MMFLRLKALEDIKNKNPVSKSEHQRKSLSDVFGENVFGDTQLKEKLAPSSYKQFKKCIETGEPLDPSIADQIATAMKEWALAKGATHFTHWFQPLHGLTAEKHDSFINFIGSPYGRTLQLNFTGKQLIKGEPDASSFPHGGIRSTFEARGYTAWDMSSPSFLRAGANGSFLCIPSAFASWTGEALDMKTPLLRSNEAISAAAVRLMRVLGDNSVTSASSQLGVEQEFFVIDRGFYTARPDLVACGRTLIGAQPPKGQQMEDHYFGSLERRILAFMQDVEWKLWKLGVPTTTRHNEVAPSQYEIAPIFEKMSIACDHNMLTMEVLKEVAREHDFACLLHEKPFAGVNGSGKHNNWSISTNTGENMMDPGSTPKENARFMAVLAALVRAVSLHGDLLRISVATPGNDFRLGMNEAPPAIMSIFIGDQLFEVVQDIISADNDITDSTPKLQRVQSKMQLGVNSLPHLPRDSSDRNRTSPFAFTGNKFEFRAVGSSQSCGRPGMIINTVMADSLLYVADEIEKKLQSGMKPELAIHLVVSNILKEHGRVIFNGNGYSDDWRKEAEKRGLPNLRTSPDAIKELTAEKNIELFEKMRVLSRREVHSAQHIMYENFSKTVAIEADCMVAMVSSHVIPAALDYKNKVSNSIDREDNVQVQFMKDISKSVSDLMSSLEHLKRVKEQAKKYSEEQLHEQSAFYRNEVFEAMAKTRAASDALEVVVDDKLWPFPKYSEMLFLK